jgi:hypothetical protein
VETFFLTEFSSAGNLRMSIMGNEADCEKAANWLIETQGGILEYEDRYSDPEDPDFRSWRIEFPKTK